jgi:hypothetical protein
MAAENKPKTVRVVTQIDQGHPTNRLIIETTDLIFDQDGKLIEARPNSRRTIELPGDATPDRHI